MLDTHEKMEILESLRTAEKEVDRIAAELLSDRISFYVTKTFDREYPQASYIELTMRFEDKGMGIHFSLEGIQRSKFDLVRYELNRMACELGRAVFLRQGEGR